MIKLLPEHKFLTCNLCGMRALYGTERKKGRSEGQKRSREQERSIAKKEHGEVTPGSGCGKKHKDDVHCDEAVYVFSGHPRIEAKSTKHITFRLDKRDLQNLESHAKEGEVPIMAVEFAHGSEKRSYWVIPREYLERREVDG